MFINPLKLGSKALISPVDITIPLSIFKLVFKALKNPICIASPIKEWFAELTPPPSKILLTNEIAVLNGAELSTSI
jgi:hypothetical protein